MASGIHGQLLEITVVGCSKLKDTEWISRQDPYVCLEYASTKFRTRTCTDGGKNPVFQEKTIFPLIEGLREIVVTVWNSNTLSFDDFIGSGKIQLQKVLAAGYDDSPWPLQSKSGRFAGEVKLIMHFPNAKAAVASNKPQVAAYGGPLYAPPNPSPMPSAPHAPSAPYPPSGAYPSGSAHYPPSEAYPPSVPYPPTGVYPAASVPYPPSREYHASAHYPPSYPPADQAMYPPSAYPPPSAMQPSYLPQPYPPAPYPPLQAYPYPLQEQHCCHAPPPAFYPPPY